jgi:AbiV family abortive infection protein
VISGGHSVKWKAGKSMDTKESSRTQCTLTLNFAGVQQSIDACLRNGKRLLEEVEWGMNGEATRLVLTMLAQEECAKAFVLALVRDGVIPWTDEVKRSLSVHECKNLVSIIMEWLFEVNESRYNELPNVIRTESVKPLPPDVATAMNIYRHEMIERLGGRAPERYSDWKGRSRRAAQGKRDRKKQLALYVDIRGDGALAAEPSVSNKDCEDELALARKLMEFAGDVNRKCIFAYREYELFGDIFRSMFADLVLTAEELANVEERFDSGIPGVVFIRRTITVADIVQRIHP